MDSKKNMKKRSIDNWFERALDDPFVLGDRRCPTVEFSPEQWKELILNDVRVFQFNVPEEEVRALVSRSDFADWDSYSICNALFFGGSWLSDLFPMEKITQEDFDFYFGEEAFPDAEEFWNVAPGFFPNGFPSHLRLPFPPPEN
ncbi:MAG: hypothetical protein J5806_02915 [Lentisphaeria bacterium]|nr:hypothetical protein [Lentisphaeria bacterium]